MTRPVPPASLTAPPSPVSQPSLRSRATRLPLVLGMALACAAFGAGAHDDDRDHDRGDRGEGLNRKPAFLGAVHHIEYDGTSDDLLTAGLGRTGLASATAPAVAIAAAPTAAELRRLAIYNNYRAIVDMTAAGGYGTFYGPNVDKENVATPGEGKVAGGEYIAFSDDGSGRRNVTLMVQVPATFDVRRPCIITATSSGSRGVYGAISTGEWGLKNGCAVAYSDKGTGGAPHDLQNDTVPLIDGTRATSAAAGNDAAFRAALTPAELATFNAATPNRFAFKHAHSQRNPEKDWGRFTLQAIEFAFYALNERFGQPVGHHGLKRTTIKRERTIVIASSVSNGGGAAIAAAELDRKGLIDGVAVSEPSIEMPAHPGITIQRGSKVVTTIGKNLFDFTSFANVYQLCAATAPALAASPGRAFVVSAFAANRCQSLKDKGLLTATTPTAQAEEALARLQEYGWEAESDVLHASLAAFEVAPAVTVTFGNAHARASVKDNLCGFSYGAVNAAFAPAPLAFDFLLPQMFGTGNGVPPSSGVTLINNNSVGGPLRDLVSLSPSTLRQDQNVDGALCMRDLLTGSSIAAANLRAGLEATHRDGNLHGKPAIIVHGRSDALLPVNHTSRPYLALNKVVEGHRSRLSYIEVTNAQHFDTFIGTAILAGYDTRYVSLHIYLFRALDAMMDHLRHRAPLPPSQVVRTVPRGGTPGAAPALTAANVPAIARRPAAGNEITMVGTTLRVPD